MNHGPAILTAWLAAEAPIQQTSDWLGYLLNGGPFAIVLLLMILDKIGTNSERDRLRIENAALRDQNQNLNDTIRTEVVAPLTEQNRLMVEIVQILDDEERFPRRRTPRKS